METYENLIIDTCKGQTPRQKYDWLIDKLKLDELAKENGFGDANNAIACAKVYRTGHSESLYKYTEIANVLRAIKGVLSADLNKLIDDKLKESEIIL